MTMRFFKLIFVIGLLTVTVSGAMANPVLTVDNALGLYFDAEAVNNNLMLDTPSTVDMYLIFTNPTVDFIDAWQAKVTISDGTEIIGVSYPLGTTGVSEGPDDWSAASSAPIPCNTLTKLAVFSVATDAMAETVIFLGGIDSPALAGELPAVRLLNGEWISVPVASGDPSVPVAGINSTTPTENSNWGYVKSLFR